MHIQIFAPQLDLFVTVIEDARARLPQFTGNPLDVPAILASKGQTDVIFVIFGCQRQFIRHVNAATIGWARGHRTGPVSLYKQNERSGAKLAKLEQNRWRTTGQASQPRTTGSHPKPARSACLQGVRPEK